MLEIWVSCLNTRVEEDLQHTNNRNPDGNVFQVNQTSFWQQVDWNHSQSVYGDPSEVPDFMGLNTGLRRKDESNLATNEWKNGSKNTIIL